MNNLELQLAENLEFALETKREDLINETYFIYKTYVSSMQKYKLKFNTKLHNKLKKDYLDYKLNLNIGDLV